MSRFYTGFVQVLCRSQKEVILPCNAFFKQNFKNSRRKKLKTAKSQAKIFLKTLGTTVLPSRLNQSNFFDILLPLAKWNMIICLLRTFLENALKKQNFPFSPLSLHCACISVGNSVFFFFKLAAPLHVLFFKVARSPFKQKYGTIIIRFF